MDSYWSILLAVFKLEPKSCLSCGVIAVLAFLAGLALSVLVH